jgi:hypothetical protein
MHIMSKGECAASSRVRAFILGSVKPGSSGRGYKRLGSQHSNELRLSRDANGSQVRHGGDEPGLMIEPQLAPGPEGPIQSADGSTERWLESTRVSRRLLGAAIYLITAPFPQKSLR